MAGSALRLAQAGCHVFPVRAGEKVPATVHGCKDATRDPEQITTWWTAMPTANVGIACGPSVLAVVDLDGAEGLTAWERLSAENPTPATLIVRTPRGGQHWYYRADPDRPLRNTAGQLGEHVDTRGPGGYVVAPPSAVGGKSYRWEHVPANGCLPVLPGWIGDALTPAPRRAASPVVRIGTASSRYADRALEGEVQAVLDAQPGTRNVTLNGSAFNLGTLVGAGMLAESLASTALLAAGEAAGLPTAEAERTIRSGLVAGMANPRRVSA